MHPEAFQWVARYATIDTPRSIHLPAVLDLGGRNINGSPRPLFPGAVYTVLDIRPGDGVDIVADAAEWDPDGRRWDVVVCTEVFEHTDAWPWICATAFRALWPGGKFIATMAGPGRSPHSAVDGGPRLHEGEHYANVEPEQLRTVLERCGFTDIVVDQQANPADVRAVAVKPSRE